MTTTRMFLMILVTSVGLPAIASSATLRDVAWADGSDYYTLLYQSIASGDVANWERLVDGEVALDAGNWREHIALEAAHLYQSAPKLVSQVYDLRGLKADVYLTRRWPKPECSRELKRLGELTAIMMELYLHGLDSYAYSGPSHRAEEERALRLGIITAVAHSGHPAALWFLLEVVEGLYEDEGTRLSALEALGHVDDERVLKMLIEAYGTVGSDAEARNAVIRAIGRQQSADAWGFVEPILRSGDAAALSAARSIAARRGWRGNADDEERVRLEVGRALLALLAAADDSGVDRLVEVISSTANSSVRERIEQLLSRRDLNEVERMRFERALSRVELSLGRRSYEIKASR